MENSPSFHPYTVSALNSAIKAILEGNPVLSSFYLRGEISNFKTYSSGHRYFSLKDDASSISCVMWGSDAYKLKFIPKDGDEVLVHGRIGVYPARGNYQVYVDFMELSGQGAELLKLQRLKEKLAAEGLFDQKNKLPLPRFPHVIAAIAGKSSAGMKDIVVNLLRHNPLVELRTYPAIVQGKDAPQSVISQFLKAEQEGAEVIIIARGGGSSEDLSAFNDESLVRALSNRKVPIISAVGHEIDTTLVDLVSDKRVSTPTAAALSSCIGKDELYLAIDDNSNALQSALKGRLERIRLRLDNLFTRPFFRRPASIYETAIEKLQEKKMRMQRGIVRALDDKKHRLGLLNARFDGLNPDKVFARGYSLTLNEEGKAIKSLKDARVGETLKTRVSDGIITSQISHTEGK